MLCLLYDRFGHLGVVRGALAGVASAAAGMMLGTAFKLVRGARPSAPMVAIGLTALGLALWRLPLPWIILGLAPLGILAAYLEARR